MSVHCQAGGPGVADTGGDGQGDKVPQGVSAQACGRGRRDVPLEVEVVQMLIVGAMVVGILVMMLVIGGAIVGGALAHKNAREDDARWAREDAERASRRDRDLSGPMGGEPLHA
ncbi:hypothetical protein COCOR_00684 [Corallococcus coralloides DSM 2259]|uniref:Uncharacterized protein n=2 Tax=Corallococcus coralloides TaxID=184914 RepID=H8MHA5_CORCM|nr:hypothetical protein COCOR_00684 [Corallococcus coralloides DSM 2259]